MKNLKDNWDTYGSKPLTEENIKLAYTVFEHIYDTLLIDNIELPEPDISPSHDGSIQFDWTLDDNVGLEITFISHSGMPKFSYLICDGPDPDDWIEGNILGGDDYDGITNTFITYLKKYL